MSISGSVNLGLGITQLTGDVTASGGGSVLATITPSAVTNIAQTLTTSKILYVSQDIGMDTNNGSVLSPYKTIQAAINAAQLISAFYNQVIIKVSPSSTGNGYNENLTITQQGIVLESESYTYRSESVVIKGNVTVNLTGTSGGTNYVAASNIVYIKGLIITATTGNTITFSGTQFQRLILSDCYLDNTGAGSAIILTNTGVSGGTKSTITAMQTDINNNSVVSPTIQVSAGRIFTYGSTYDIQNFNASGVAVVVDGASAAGPTALHSLATITGQIQVSDNTANVYLNLCNLNTGAAAAITTPASPSTGLITLGNVGINSTAVNVITGAGVVVLAGVLVRLNTGGDIASTVTQAALGMLPQGPLLLGAGATQTTNAMLTLKNGHIKIQQTTAPTISAANSGSGATASLSNATDSAGKITYTTGTGAITTTATVTVTFNKTYAVAPIVVLTPNNSVAGQNLVQIYVTTSTSAMTLNFATAPAASTSYTWFYHVVETQ